MSGKSGYRVRLGAVLFGCLAAAAAHPAPASAQSYASAAAEQPSDALARNIKILATQPRDFNALIAAGKAALALGDGQAAAGFFGRAEEVWPASPQPQIGKGAALAHEGDAAPALQYFARAGQLGATQSIVGAERGLAYDLLGYHDQAQADYRAALVGPDGNEARRRLALSLAISGDKSEALALLGPLMARGDAGAARCRAFVLALTGDTAGARASIEAAMPGSSRRMEYFFHKLPTLRSEQKAAAVHLGLFPDATQLASAQPSYATSVPSYGQSAPTGDRLSSIDQLLAQGAPSTSQPPLARQPSPAQSQLAQVAPALRQPTRRAGAVSSAASAAAVASPSSRYWVQLASGTNAEALPGQFRRIKLLHRRAFQGINGYVAEDGDRARLLIGPFQHSRDAQTFASDLASINVNAYSWTSRPGQLIRKLPAE